MSAKSFVKQFSDNVARLPKRFGQKVVYTPSGGTAKTITGAFREKGDTIPIGGERITVTDPVLKVLSADLSGSSQESTFLIDGTTYKASEYIDDSRGLTILILRIPA